MTDRYLNDQQCIDRLLNEWQRYGNLVIAVDFDNTLYDYHSRGDKYDNVIALIRKVHKMGCRVVVFTCCDETRFSFIEKYMRDNDIPFDAINEDAAFIEYRGRKIYFNWLLDDRSGLSAAYHILNEVCERVWLIRNADQIKSKQDIDF